MDATTEWGLSRNFGTFHFRIVSPIAVLPNREATRKGAGDFTIQTRTNAPPGKPEKRKESYE